MIDQTATIIRSLAPGLQPVAIAFISGLRSYGLPAVITSGRRSALHNAAIGGAVNSRHLTGQAFDLGFYGYSNASLPTELWWAVGSYGEMFGLRWGGRFQSPDYGHFDTG